MFKKIKLVKWLVWFHVAIFMVAVGLLMRHKDKAAPGNDKIVVIPIEGVITMGSRGLGRGQTVDSLVSTLNKIKDNKRIKAVVLRINSPGGSVGAVQEIYDALLALKNKGKVIVSSFGDVAASGGYYIACAGDKIVSNPGSITGSIGVVAQFPNVEGLFEKIGINMNLIKSGAMKDVGSPFRAMTANERQYIRSLILDTYGQFYDAVKAGRDINNRKLRQLADGRIFSGRMAHKNKLVDELGGLQKAIEVAKDLTGLKGKKPQVITHKPKASLQQLLDFLSNSPVKEFESLTQGHTQILYMMQ